PVRCESFTVSLHDALPISSGASWAFANVLTIAAFSLKDSAGNILGSSKAMPISTAFQISANVLWGVIMLGNWPSFTAKLLGFLRSEEHTSELQSRFDLVCR